MLTKRKTLRRAAILYCHALSNIAYYKAGWSNGKPRFNGNVEITLTNNFLDVAVMEWCKLFGDKKGSELKRIQQHSWIKVVLDTALFEIGLLNQLDCSAMEFDRLRCDGRLWLSMDQTQRRVAAMN